MIQNLSQHLFLIQLEKKKKYNKQGELLLIEKQFISKFTWDTYAEYENYFKSQKKFVERLQTKITKKMIIKLHPRFHYISI